MTLINISTYFVIKKIVSRERKYALCILGCIRLLRKNNLFYICKTSVWAPPLLPCSGLTWFWLCSFDISLSRDVPGQRSLSQDFCCYTCPGTKGHWHEETFFVPGQWDVPSWIGPRHPIPWKPSQLFWINVSLIPFFVFGYKVRKLRKY